MSTKRHDYSTDSTEARRLSPAREAKRASIAALAVAALALGAAPVAAADPYEPNDSAVTATGPVMANVDYSTTIDTQNDEDWFVMYVPGHEQLTLIVSGQLIGVDLANAGTSWPGGHDGYGWTSQGGTHTFAKTLEQGIYYIRFFPVSTNPGGTATFRVLTSGSLVDRATYEWLLVKPQYEKAALAARAADANQINYWRGQASYWTGKVTYWTGRITYWTAKANAAKADVKRKLTALHRAHGRRAVALARSRLNAAHRNLRYCNGGLGNAKAQLGHANRMLRGANGSLGYWRVKWNTDNASVIKYA